VTKRKLSIETSDAHCLTAYCYEPSAPARANVVIAPAMAVAQSFYAAFAAFLATQGFRVWTFDYRGMAESATGPMRHCKADVTAWVEHDFEAVVRHAGEALPLYVVGHSLGGQVAPALPSVRRIAGLVNIAVGSGAVRHNQPRQRPGALLLWYILVPLLCPLFGYFPGRRVGIVGDLPARVMRQWRRWCLTPDYFLGGEPGGREAYARAAYPVLGLTFDDDELLLPAGSRMMHEAYRTATVDYREMRPEQVGLRRIGHFGFFRAEPGQVLWPLVADWLGQHVQGAT
jgi:predicted alpha/beta hydrolase